MEQEKEIQELKKRIETLEHQVQSKAKLPGAVKFVLSFIIVFMLLLVLIGIFQFVSASE